MDRDRIISIIRRSIGLLLFLVIGLVIYWWLRQPDDNLHLIFCDVGQGDAILISFQHQQVLIDGGPDNSVLGCLGEQLPFWDREIELMILTHPDSDHLSGLIKVLENYQVNQFIGSGVGKATAEFEAFTQALNNEACLIDVLEEANRLKLGPIELEVLWPDSAGDKLVYQPNSSQALGEQVAVNEESLVLELNYGDFQALLTGDIGEKTETLLLDKLKQGIEVLKVPHHGSKYSSSLEFLEQVKPQLAVISVGKNRWGHPTAEVLERLNQVGSRILRTDLQGLIELITNGQGYWLAN